jgi:hypothetical protein
MNALTLDQLVHGTTTCYWWEVAHNLRPCPSCKGARATYVRERRAVVSGERLTE